MIVMAVINCVLCSEWSRLSSSFFAEFQSSFSCFVDWETPKRLLPFASSLLVIPPTSRGNSRIEEKYVNSE